MKIFLLILLGVIVVGIVAFSFVLGAIRRLFKGVMIPMQQPVQQKEHGDILYSKNGVTISKGEANKP
jgi:hypothetical protein